MYIEADLPIFEGRTAAVLREHQADCREDRERTRQSFDTVRADIRAVEMRLEKRAHEIATRIELGTQATWAEAARRFDKIEGVMQRIYFGVMAALLGLVIFGAEHFLAKYMPT